MRISLDEYLDLLHYCTKQAYPFTAKEPMHPEDLAVHVQTVGEVLTAAFGHDMWRRAVN